MIRRALHTNPLMVRLLWPLALAFKGGTRPADDLSGARNLHPCAVDFLVTIRPFDPGGARHAVVMPVGPVLRTPLLGRTVAVHAVPADDGGEIVTVVGVIDLPTYRQLALATAGGSDNGLPHDESECDKSSRQIRTVSSHLFLPFTKYVSFNRERGSCRYKQQP
jgi:hypothetical protein